MWAVFMSGIEVQNNPSVEPVPQVESSSLTGNSKKINIKFIVLIILLVIVAIGLIFFYYFKFGASKSEPREEIDQKVKSKAEGMMILIEYKDTIGLVNFVNEMHKRNIPGLLHLSSDFVEANCDTVKELLKYDMEMMASLGGKPAWDMSYDEQKKEITDTVKTIEVCTGVPVKIISSVYMASDMSTLKVAEELGIPYITARGTTDTKATIYQIEGFKTKILSVSNIPMVQFKYGSLCDYSFYERSGTPDDMMSELLRAVEPLTLKEQARYGPNHKITPVTHTNIGGYLKPWTDMWLNFWDTTRDEIDWVDLNTFMADADWILPDWQMPINKNAPYTPEKIRPLVPYDEIEKVQNPCRVEDISKTELEEKEQFNTNIGNKIMMFHNGSGPMCLDALDFIKTLDYPVEQYLDYEEGFGDKLNKLKKEFDQSEGVSQVFGYYPIIFINDKAYSGFDNNIKQKILDQISKSNN